MAANPKLTNLAANAAADAVCALLDGGKIKLYTGDQPVTADTALSGQTLLATLTFGTPAFGSAVGGLAVANPITQDDDAAATGTAAWFRVTKADNTAVFDGSVMAVFAALVMATTSINQHDIVTLSAFSYRASKG